MKHEFLDYLKSLSMPDAYLERTTSVIEQIERLFTLNTDDLFITDYIKDDGERVFESLWLFDGGLLVEAKNFLKQEDFDLIRLKSNVAYLRVMSSNFNFAKATNKSRLNIEFNFRDGSTGLSAQMRASRENCVKLLGLLQTYISPNLSSPPVQ